MGAEQLRGKVGPLYTNPNFAEHLVGKEVIGIIGPSSTSCDIKLDPSTISSLKNPRNRLIYGTLVDIKNLQSPFLIRSQKGEFFCKEIREVIEDDEESKLAEEVTNMVLSLRDKRISVDSFLRELYKIYPDLKTN